jgi:hypothetical protein
MEDDLEPRTRTQRCGRGAQAWGLFNIIVLNSAGDISSYYFAPQALLAPLSGLPIVLNALLAPRVCCAGPV